MQSVIAAGCVGALTDFDDVLAVRRSDHRSKSILQRQSGVIIGRQFESLFVQDGNIRIKVCGAQTHRNDFCRDTLPFCCLNDVVIDVFIGDVSVDDVVQRDFLGCLKDAVGLFFV